MGRQYELDGGGGHAAACSWPYSRPARSSQHNVPSAYATFQDSFVGR